MGISSLAVMANSLLLQFEGRPPTIAASKANNAQLQQQQQLATAPSPAASGAVGQTAAVQHPSAGSGSTSNDVAPA